MQKQNLPFMPLFAPRTHSNEFRPGRQSAKSGRLGNLRHLGGGKTIKTDYSSPRAKGRKIFGELVPYGKVWRTGANEASTFVPSTDVTVGEKNCSSGKLHDLHSPERR